MTPHSRELADAAADLRHCIAIASQSQPDWRPTWESALSALLRREPSVEEVARVIRKNVRSADSRYGVCNIPEAARRVAALWGREPG